MSVDILKEELKNKKIRNLYLFYGPEEYLKRYYLESIEKSLLTEELKMLNRIVLEGKPNINRMMDNCETLPVFSEKKVVIVKNSGLFKPKSKGSDGETKGKQNDELGAFLQNVPEHTCLIFYEEEVDKRMKAVDLVKKNGLVVEFVFQKPAELVKWVIKVFKSFKKEIDPYTASQLVDNCEQGMTEVLNEVNKVVLYVGDRAKVNAEDIEKVCTKSVKGRIFDLTDAIAEKNTVRALKLLNDMIILKEPLPKILFMIARHFRHILEMKLLTARGMSLNEAASRIGISPYAAGKIQKQAGSFPVDVLQKALEESLKLDSAIKTGRINDRIAAELLITEFSLPEKH